MRVVYFVHDLSDPAVARRVQLLAGAGAELTVLGFQRAPRAFPSPLGVRLICLGATEDGRLARRALTVLRELVAPRTPDDVFEGAIVVVARQLEMLLIAYRARLAQGSDADLVYECLDIHTLMTGQSQTGRLLRGLEAWLLRRCAVLVVSSQAFIRSYFVPVHGGLPRTVLLENKVVRAELPNASVAAIERLRSAPAPSGPPWRIGWFGVIRCRRSLEILAKLARCSAGRVELVIRGKPAYAAIADFDEVVARSPGLAFLGSYDRQTELAAIHSGIHFIWAVDYYEAGANSDWLLPNRIYEGGLCGAVPIARAATESGRWLRRRDAGALFDDPLIDSLRGFFGALDTLRYRALRDAVLGIPMNHLVCSEAEGQAALRAIAPSDGDADPAAAF